MADAKAEEKVESSSRDRSPSYPSIGLGKAVERTKVLFDKAKRYETRLEDAAASWDLAAKSSSTLQLVASLLAFGLIESTPSPSGRKVKVSDLGWKILEDQRPGVREKLLAEAALKPKLIAEYAGLWKEGRPDDGHAISQLKFESGFTDEAARKFLRVFDETIRFTEAGKSDSVTDTGTEERDDQRKAKIGDFIQWTSNGVDQLQAPLRVVGLSDDGLWLWVDRSDTAIPMNETQVVPPPNMSSGTAAPPPPPPAVAAALAAQQAPKFGAREEKFALTEGDVIIRFPAGLSADSVEDLDAYLKVFLKKAQREAGVKKKEDAAN